jgi:leader peptidase (prepilin peptidase)/N-methyltransferase
MNPLEWGLVERVVAWGILGLFVGSFLNVAIHRLPREGMSVAHPRRSLCPECGRQLTWKENIPLVSWIAQGGRCRGCAGRIPLRYPLVELLNAGLWAFVAWFHPPADWARVLLDSVVLSGLVVAAFVDFACFEIPDQISIGGMLLAPIAVLALPRLHADTWLAQRLSTPEGIDRFGALCGCLAGMAAGGGILLAIGWLGKRIYGIDAMGLGDVKLLCGAGGLLGPGGTLLALIVACLVASVAGIGKLLCLYALLRRRRAERGRPRARRRSWSAARVAGRYVPFGPYLALGIGIALFAWNDVVRWLFE